MSTKRHFVTLVVWAVFILLCIETACRFGGWHQVAISAGFGLIALFALGYVLAEGLPAVRPVLHDVAYFTAWMVLVTFTPVMICLADLGGATLGMVIMLLGGYWLQLRFWRVWDK